MVFLGRVGVASVLALPRGSHVGGMLGVEVGGEIVGLGVGSRKGEVFNLRRGVGLFF